MKRSIIFFFLAFVLTASLLAQQPGKVPLRIADTLTAQEKLNRSSVLLKSELDSLIKLYSVQQVDTVPKEPVKEDVEAVNYPFWTAAAGILIIAFLLYIIFRNQQRFARSMRAFHKQLTSLEWTAKTSEQPSSLTQGGKKASPATLEKKIQTLTQELEKAEKRSEGLELVMNEYRHIKQEYEAVKAQILDIYKVRNYPGVQKDSTESDLLKGLLNTERSVALYAYEHFLKPVIAIADSNKNNPARISKEEREKMLDLLLSLALLYTEYLYLRVNDLAVGGKIVERIGGLKNGNAVDLALLKELNLEHGSRALTLRIALDKMGIKHLSYPVFDETNLNLS
jgi:hypothetical protein